MLDRLLDDAGPRRHLDNDPIGLVRPYRGVDSQELVGLFAALLAYGRVASIRASLRLLFHEWGPDPAAALREDRHLRADWAPGFQHRWTRREDVRDLMQAVRTVWNSEGSLGAALAARVSASGDFERGLVLLLRELRAIGRRGRRESRGLRFLLADPSSGSACKRLRLYLRWMIRPDDGIDLGLWGGRFERSVLVVPLDVHWARMGPRLGLTRRSAPDGRMALEITENLRRIRPEDPLAYDFPVCHLGIGGACPEALTSGDCRRCPLRGGCATGRRRAPLRSTG